MNIRSLMLSPSNVVRFGTDEYAKRQDQFYRKWLHETPVSQYVYIIKDRLHPDTYKIGRTTNPAERLTNFDVRLPFSFYIVAIIECSNSFNLEAELHKQYNAKRGNGEWFKLSAFDVANLKALELFMPTNYLHNRSGGRNEIKPSPQKDFFRQLDLEEINRGD